MNQEGVTRVSSALLPSHNRPTPTQRVRVGLDIESFGEKRAREALGICGEERLFDGHDEKRARLDNVVDGAHPA